MHVTALASGGKFTWAIFNEESSPSMESVDITAVGIELCYAVHNLDSWATLSDVSAVASGATIDNVAIMNSASSGSYTVKVDNCQLTGGRAIGNDAAYTTLVTASLLDGLVDAGGGTVRCAGVYDESYHFYTTTCP
jgi:hypothetical protein